ncbi:MAG TPA: hypothetical protein VN851_21575 [Thermoanaerobaculia bacterium]|nr:hypothetical protein [Thermoanaerobaculia bacterium]
MTPRNLRVLYLDDRRYDAEQPIGEAASTTADRTRPIEPYVVRDTRGSIHAISGWRTARRFWSCPAAASPGPDLVISDVLFEEDADSPLSRVPGLPDHKHLIPTGLGHVKPFAAVARAVDRPIGLAIHTRNADLWKDAWTAEHPMGALAAHEIGELAAILGEDIGGDSLDESVEHCWAWLRDRSRDDFDAALYIAMSHFRRGLMEATQLRGLPGHDNRPSILILPSEWVRLVAWITDRANGGSSPLDPDLGVSLVYSNGERDCIRLISLFGEIEDIGSTAFPPRCFRANPEEGTGLAPWALDDARKPQIGRFVMALGSVAEAFEKGISLKKKFPLPAQGKIHRTIVDEAGDVPQSSLIQGFAVLFQVLEWERKKYLGWTEGITMERWVPNEIRFADQETGCSLGSRLKSLADFVIDQEEPFTRDDILEEQPDLFPEARTDSAWVQWHFDRLVEAGVISQTTTNVYKALNRRLSLDQVPAPSTLPTGFPGGDLGQLKSGVRDSLGFQPGNFNALGQRLSGAFLAGGTPAQGTAFLEHLLEGQGPPWLLELLREYATDELEWTEERTWPEWLRRLS